MKIWKSLSIILSLIALAVASYWTYSKYFSFKKINNLELISQDAVFVLKTNHGADTWNKLVSHPSWEILKNFPAFQRISQQLSLLDSLTGNNGKIFQILNNKTLTVSYHPTGSENFNLLFTLEIQPQSGQELITGIENKIHKDARFVSRTYSDQPVIEYFNSDNNRSWSVAFLENIMILSESSFLIEEAIRNYINPDQPNFPDLLDSNFFSSNSESQFLISTKGLANLIKGTSQSQENRIVDALELYQAVASLDLILDEKEIRFEGPIHFAEKINFTPSLQANLNLIEEAISNHTTSLTQYNLGSIFETQKLVNRAFPVKSTIEAEIQRNLIDRGFLDSFTGELYLLNLESFGGSDQNKALLCRTIDPENTFDLLRGFLETDNSEISDFYLKNEILFIPEEEFPAHLFKGKFPGFNQTFATITGELLIFTNSQQGMKLILDDIISGNSWGKSERAPQAKSELIPVSGFSKLLLTDKIWTDWTQNTKASWSTFFQKYATAFQAFPYISFHINQRSDLPIATLTLPFTKGTLAETNTDAPVKLSSEKRIDLNSILTYGPKAIINYQDNTEDLVVQDENNILHLINSAGEIVFSTQLSAPIISEVFQVDYYKNGKLQLLLATTDHLYGIDRLGNPLPNYPFSLNGETISNLNLVDYNNTKEYRYFLSTENGNLFLLDKTGKKLDGWDPLRTHTKTIGPPSHYRVPGSGDYMVAMGQNGELNLFNRRGERQSGSPIELGGEFLTHLIFNREINSGISQLVGISKRGEVVKLNFDGEITYRNQLMKDDRDSEFHLIPDQKELNYLIFSRNFNQVKVIDHKEQELFTVRIPEGALHYQYFDFGSDRKFIVITDLTQSFSYLYDLKGKLQTQLPIESSGPLQISYHNSQGQFIIRSISGKYLTEHHLSD